MTREHLVFFASSDPEFSPGPAWSEYHFAEGATRGGLDADVRLAGDAVRVAKADGVVGSPKGESCARRRARAPCTVPRLALTALRGHP